MESPKSPSVESTFSLSSLPTEDADYDPSLKEMRDSAVLCEFEEDEKFYFRSDNVKLIVGTRIYNIPRLPLERHSEFFRALFATASNARLPPGWSEQQLDIAGTFTPVYVHGTDNIVQTMRPSSAGPHHDAYPLYDVSADEFSVFLSVLYPDDHTTFDLSRPEEWMIVLKLSARWQFASIRKLALGRLGPLLRDAPLERLAVSRAYGISHWAADALQRLIFRPEPLSSVELPRLSYDDVAYIMKQREKVARVHIEFARGGRIQSRSLALVTPQKAAADTISRAYLRWMRSRRRPVLGVHNARMEQIYLCLRQDRQINWPSRCRYRLIFRGPLPHALTCVDRLLYQAQARGNQLKIIARISQDEELEKYMLELNKKSDLVKELLALHKELEPSSALHRTQSLEQLRPRVARLCELVIEHDKNSTLQFDSDIAYRGIVL